MYFPGNGDDRTTELTSTDVSMEFRIMTDQEQWTVLESGIDHEGFYRAGYDRVAHPDGTEQSYEWIALPDIVVIVACTGKEIVLVDQYRPAAKTHVVECPAGIPEADESPIETAIRELREETGYRTDSGRLLYTHNPLPGLLRHQLHVVFLSDVTPGETDMDDSEFIETRTVPVADAIEVVRTPPANGMTLMALLIAQEDGLL